MKSTVDLDETLVAQARKLTGSRTTPGVIREALRARIRLHRQEQVGKLRGRLRWEGDLAVQRCGRSSGP